MMKNALIVASVGALLFSLIPPQVQAATVQDFYSDNDILFYDEDATAAPVCVAGSTVSGGASVQTNFTLGSDEVERRVNLVKALVADYGLTAQQAAGIVGNFMHESGGKNLPPNVNEGGVAGPPRFSGGYGWAQWTGPRQRSFIQYAVDNKYMASQNVDATDAANYAYLKHELDTGYKVTITELKKQATPEDAAVSFEATFEKAGVPAIEPRKANARQAFIEYSSTSPGATGGCVQNGSATIVGDVAFPLAGSKSIVNNPEIFSANTTATAGHPYTAYDILADTGTPVVAFLSGVVTSVSTDRCPGRLISIYNAESDLTISYLHLSLSNHISQGTVVRAGDRVGIVGTTQNGCTIPHLHIDAVKGERRVGCSRLSCPTENQAYFRDIGPQLYQTYQAMPE